MATARNPFALARPQPGHGEVHVTLLPPSAITVKTLRYTYPLKLVLSSPHPARAAAADGSPRDIRVPLLFTLSYGGGILPPDALHLSLTLDPHTRLTLATQGSTKVFPSPDPALKPVPGHAARAPFVARQTLTVALAAGAALLLSPDPVQPFRGSHYSQAQTFTLQPGASLCFLDWVSSGRPARGEVWAAGSWRGRNEVWVDRGGGGAKTLLLRDAVLLADGPDGAGQRSLRAEGKGVFGTLAAHGPLFEQLGAFFADEFAAQPRHGAKDWDGEAERDDTPALRWRRARLRREAADGVLWSAARSRGVVVVKFAAAHVEGAKAWLLDMLVRDGTVEREFGPGGLMSVR